MEERRESILHHGFFFVMLLTTCLLSAVVISEVCFKDYTPEKGDGLMAFAAVVLPLLWEYISVKEIDDYDED